jgi:hypothetical protein
MAFGWSPLGFKGVLISNGIIISPIFLKLKSMFI